MDLLRSLIRQETHEGSQCLAGSRLVEAAMRENGFDAVVLFGAERLLHRVAIECAEEMGIPVVCLEEGYIRPGYVTMELSGNNWRSPIAGQLPPEEFNARLPGIDPSGLSPKQRLDLAQPAVRLGEHQGAVGEVAGECEGVRPGGRGEAGRNEGPQPHALPHARQGSARCRPAPTLSEGLDRVTT